MQGATFGAYQGNQASVHEYQQIQKMATFRKCLISLFEVGFFLLVVVFSTFYQYTA